MLRRICQTQRLAQGGELFEVYNDYYFHTQTLVEQSASDDPDTEFNLGCVLFKVD